MGHLKELWPCQAELPTTWTPEPHILFIYHCHLKMYYQMAQLVGRKKRKGKFQTPVTGSCLFSVIWWGQTITKQESGIPSNCLGPSACFLVQQTAVTEHTQPAWGTHRLLYWLDPDPSCMLFVSTSWICQSLKAKPMLLVHFLSSFPSQPPLPLIFWSKKNKKQMRVAQIS